MRTLFSDVARAVRADLTVGKYRPGDKLPTMEQFARELNVSANTVARALHELKREGYLSSIPSKGFYVVALPEPRRAWHTITRDQLDMLIGNDAIGILVDDKIVMIQVETES